MTKHARRRIAILTTYWFCAFMFVWVTPAWAYIDPATTTYIIQVAAAIVITLGVSLSIFLYKFQMVVTNIRITLHALARRLGVQRDKAVATGNLPSGQKGGAPALLSEEDALAAGIIDYPIPASSSYPAVAPLASYSFKVVASPEEETATEAPARKNWLVRFGRWLWCDERKLKQRLPVSALVGAGLSMTYMMFPMFDSVITNESEIPFLLGDVIGGILLLGLIAFVILTAFLVALHGRFFDLAICVALSFLICGYLQVTFFNSSIGQLIGTPMGWEELGVNSVIVNLLIWIAIFVVVLTFGLIRRARRQVFRRRAFLFVPALILSVQLIALFSILPSSSLENTLRSSKSEFESENLYLTWAGLNEISSQNNIIVFILDTFDMEYVNGILKEDPHFFDNLDGFTYFPNNTTVWNSTYPSVINFITGLTYDTNTLRVAYTEEAFRQGTFFADIIDQGYTANIYMEDPHCYSNGEQLEGLAGNLHPVICTINNTSAIKRLIRLNLLKVTPLAVKSYFWLPPDLFVDVVEIVGTQEAGIYRANDVRFYQEIAKGLSVSDEAPHFTYYHLNGSHAPRIMNAQAQYVEEGVSTLEQTRGCFFILNEYFRQMKELGIYEDATIIITGDHPEHQMHKLLDAARPVGLFVKPSGSADTLLQISYAPVSIDNLRATCVQAAGGDTSRWGRTYFEVAENEPAVRYYHHRYTDGRGIHYTAVFRIIGDANDWKNWELISQTVQDPKYWF